MSRQWTARKTTSVIETAIDPSGFNAAFPIFRAGQKPAAARTLAFSLLLAYTLVALPAYCGVYWLTAWSYSTGALTVVAVSVLLAAFAVAKWLGLEDLLQKLPLLLVLVLVGAALLYFGSTERAPSPNGGLDFFGTTLIVIAAVSVLGSLYRPLASAYSTLTLKTRASELGIAAAGLYGSLSLASLGQNLAPEVCIVGASIFVGWFASLVVFEYARWLQANPDRSPCAEYSWNAPENLMKRRGAVLIGGQIAGLGFGLALAGMKAAVASEFAGGAAVAVAWGAGCLFGGICLLHVALGAVRPDFTPSVFRLTADALVVFLTYPDTRHPLAHRLGTWWLRPQAMRLVLTGLVLATVATMFVAQAKNATKDEKTKNGAAAGSATTPRATLAPPQVAAEGNAPFERHLNRGFEPHERFHQPALGVFPQPAFAPPSQKTTPAQDGAASSFRLTDMLAAFVALALAPPLVVYALVLLVGIYALPRYHARYEATTGEGMTGQESDDPYEFLTNPILAAHPLALRKTLIALNADRPESPWDAKVGRLLNGLRSPHFYIGRALEDGAPWLLHRNLLHTHAHMLGGTGTGKTALGLLPLTFQLIARADSSVVVIDLKGDRAMFWGAFVEAARAKLPFRWFSIEPGCASYVFNPLTQRHEAERTVAAWAQSLLISTGLRHGDDYGKGYFQAQSLDVFTGFLERFDDIRSFADFSSYAEENGSYLSTSIDMDDALHLRMVLRQLATVAPLNVTDGTRPEVREEVRRDAIDMTDVVTEKQVLYFHLPSMEEELTATSVARLAMYALAHAAKVASRKQQTVPVYVIVDEAQQVLGQHTKILLEMARSHGVYFVLAHQSADQLKSGDHDVTSTVEACTTFKMFFEASSTAALRDMEEFGGVVRSKSVSWAQPIHPGFDENNDDEFSPSRARSPREFEPAVAPVSEILRPVLSRQALLAVSAHPLQALVRSRSDSGLTQYAGQYTKIECEFPTTEDEYKLRSKTPLPGTHPSCITVLARPDDPDEGLGALVNNPLPVDPPPPAVNGDIDARLRKVREGQPKFPKLSQAGG